MLSIHKYFTLILWIYLLTNFISYFFQWRNKILDKEEFKKGSFTLFHIEGYTFHLDEKGKVAEVGGQLITWHPQSSLRSGISKSQGQWPVIIFLQRVSISLQSHNLPKQCSNTRVNCISHSNHTLTMHHSLT